MTIENIVDRFLSRQRVPANLLTSLLKTKRKKLKTLRKRVINMSQLCKQKVVTVNYIKTQYEKKFNTNIPQAIIHLIFLFSTLIIPSVILSLKQDLDFCRKLRNAVKFNIKQFRLKYRASEHGFKACKFKEFCGKSMKPFANITIIKSNHGNIFGGFTTLSWNSGNLIKSCNVQYLKDNEAFVYIISSHEEEIQKKCPIIFGIRQNTTAICTSDESGPAYGLGDIHISDECNKQMDLAKYILENGDKQDVWTYCRKFEEPLSVNWSKLQNYYNQQYPNITNLCGGNDKATFWGELCNVFDVIEYEVFELIKDDNNDNNN